MSTWHCGRPNGCPPHLPVGCSEWGSCGNEGSCGDGGCDFPEWWKAASTGQPVQLGGSRIRSPGCSAHSGLKSASGKGLRGDSMEEPGKGWAGQGEEPSPSCCKVFSA